EPAPDPHCGQRLAACALLLQLPFRCLSDFISNSSLLAWRSGSDIFGGQNLEIGCFDGHRTIQINGKLFQESVESLIQNNTDECAVEACHAALYLIQKCLPYVLSRLSRITECGNGNDWHASVGAHLYHQREFHIHADGNPTGTAGRMPSR